MQLRTHSVSHELVTETRSCLLAKTLSIKKGSAPSPCQKIYITICLSSFSGKLLHRIGKKKKKKAYEKTKTQHHL